MKRKSYAHRSVDLIAMLIATLPLALAGNTGAAADKPQSTTPTTEAIVVINGKSLTRADFGAFVAMRIGQRPQEAPTAQELDSLLNEYINRELIYQDAVRRGFDKAPEVIAALDNQERNIIASYTVRRLTSAPVSDSQLKDAYDRLMSKPTREYKARHILVQTESEANSIVQQLRKGADFSKLAQEKSLDSSGKNGGNLGWFAPSQVVEPFAKAVMSMDEGSYSTKPIQTRFGWHVIQLDGTRIVPPPSLESVRDKLTAAVNNEIVGRYLSGLREQAKVEVQKR